MHSTKLIISDQKQQAQFETAFVEPRPLGEGSYNTAYHLPFTQPPTVLKIALSVDKDAHGRPIYPESDHPDRSTRLYFDLTGQNAYVITHKDRGKGWISTYQSSPVPATPVYSVLIAEALIHFYLKHRRLIVDGADMRNWRLSDTGEVLCIDPGLALRRGSIVSDKCWSRGIKDYQVYWNGLFKKTYSNISYPALHMILTLKYLEDKLTPSQIKDDYICYPILAALRPIREKKLDITEDFLKTLKLIHTIQPFFFGLRKRNINYIYEIQNIFYTFDLSDSNIEYILKNITSELNTQLKKIDNLVKIVDANSLIHTLDTEKKVLAPLFPHLSSALKALVDFNINTSKNIQQIFKDQTLQTTLVAVHDCILNEKFDDLLKILQNNIKVLGKIFTQELINILTKMLSNGTATKDLIYRFIKNNSLIPSLEIFIKNFPKTTKATLQDISEMKQHEQRFFNDACNYLKQGEYYKFSQSIKNAAIRDLFTPHLRTSLRYLDEKIIGLGTSQYYEEVISNEPLQKAIEAAYNYLESNQFGFFKPHGTRAKTLTLQMVTNLLKMSSPTSKDIALAMREWIRTKKSSLETTARTAYAADSTILGIYPLFKDTSHSQRKVILSTMLEYKPR